MYIGTNLCYDVGTLSYVQDEKANHQQIGTIAGSSIAGMLLLSLFIIFIVICCYIIRSKKKKRKFAHTQMELKEVRMADTYKKESHYDFTGMIRHVNYTHMSHVHVYTWRV